MNMKYKLNAVPFRSISVIFILWSNSDYATYGKNVGFLCDDESIRKPYFGDTVHITYLFGSLLGVIALIIYVTEIIFKHDDIRKAEQEKKNRAREGSQYRLLIKYYYSGFLFVLLFTEVLKCFISELRPHFFYTCLPDMSKVDCSKGLVTYFNCTGTGNQWLVDRDIYKSFPSGHAATSVYAFIFMYVYFNSKQNDKSKLSIWWIRCMMSLCFVWTVFCCISRITDNRHFWWDVLAGIGIGLIGGFTMICLTLKKVKERLKNCEEFHK